MLENEHAAEAEEAIRHREARNEMKILQDEVLRLRQELEQLKRQVFGTPMNKI